MKTRHLIPVLSALGFLACELLNPRKNCTACLGTAQCGLFNSNDVVDRSAAIEEARLGTKIEGEKAKSKFPATHETVGDTRAGSVFLFENARVQP